MPSGPKYKTLTVGGLFSGIGGFEIAALVAGMRVSWSCEIDPDCRAVLKTRFPSTPIYNDVKEISFADGTKTQVPRVDVLCGGFPCQNLSIAGKRAGLEEGVQSSLFFEFARLIEEGQPRWVVIENVPGLLSSQSGRDMGIVLTTLGELGYGWSYRVLDAQFTGVAQRRRRVLIVGHLGDGTSAREVLLEPEGSWGDSPPSRTARASTSPDPETRLGGGGAVAFDWQAGGGGNDNSFRGKSRSWIVKQGDYTGAIGTTKVQAVATTLTAGGSSEKVNPPGRHKEDDYNLVVSALTANMVGGGGGADDNSAQANHLIPMFNETGHGWWSGPDGVTGTQLARNYKSPQSLVTEAPTAFSVYPDTGGGGNTARVINGAAPTLTATAEASSNGRGTFVVADTIRSHPRPGSNSSGAVVVFRKATKAHGPVETDKSPERWEEADTSPTLDAAGHGPRTATAVTRGTIVRRLLPVECSRLQGFPDEWLDVLNAKGKPMPDSSKYRMLGNAIAVPMALWVFRRLVEVDRASRVRETVPQKPVRGGTSKPQTQILQGDVMSIPLADNSVDIIITSPPYWSLRNYTDDGERLEGQLGQEDTPAEYIEHLLQATREMVRVLKPTGSLFINLGDKYAGSGGHNNSGIGKTTLEGRHQRLRVGAPRRDGPARYQQSTNVRVTEAEQHEVRKKSLMGMPWRYALACIDELDLILRAEIIWDKPNGLPESVRDRVSRKHEQWFHLVKEGDYYAQLDTIRIPALTSRHPGGGKTFLAMKKLGHVNHALAGLADAVANEKGKVPPSVWKVSSQPFRVPSELGIEHFAAFPTEWPKRFIQGWCPPDGFVLDPFGGTGSTALAAQELGRSSLSLDLSYDYCRLAEWRTSDPKQIAKMRRRIEGKK